MNQAEVEALGRLYEQLRDSNGTRLYIGGDDRAVLLSYFCRNLPLDLMPNEKPKELIVEETK